MHKLDVTIIRLRLLLAEVSGKIDTLQAMQQQYHEQQNHIMNFTIRGDGHVDRALSMLLEIDGRSDAVTRSLGYLDRLRAHAQRELDSLLLTKLIEESRAQLNALRQQQSQLASSRDATRYHVSDVFAQSSLPESELDSVPVSASAQRAHDIAWITTEIRRLESVIQEASKAAARSVSAASPVA